MCEATSCTAFAVRLKLRLAAFADSLGLRSAAFSDSLGLLSRLASCDRTVSLMRPLRVRISLLNISHAASSCALQSFFERMYMGKTSGLYGRAVDNFVRSLAAYAIVTYMLQVPRPPLLFPRAVVRMYIPQFFWTRLCCPMVE